MNNFQSARRVRREYRSETGRIRGGKLYPCMAHKVEGSASGTLTQRLSVELDPIPGRLISEIVLEMFSIYVPLQALDAIKDPLAAYAGMTEVVREKLLSGTPVMGLENEGEISRRSAVKPRSIGGQKKVNEAVRLAYNCAINMLRQRAYFRATLLPHTNTAIAPAIYAQTVLDKINGVLDPDDRVNGAVPLELPTMSLPVTGIGVNDANEGVKQTHTIRESTGAVRSVSGWNNSVAGTPGAGAAFVTVEGDANNWPKIAAQLNGQFAGNLSLVDFYNAKTMDEFARTMDTMMRDNPQYGEEMVLRWAHGLSVDPGRNPFILAERRVVLNKSLQAATDTAGVNDDVLRTDGGVKVGITVPLPKTELGGVVVTLLAIKPDEKLASQPHPFLSDVWTADNFVADSLALDPVPVTVRDLYSDCAAGVEANVVAYTGLNALKEVYVDYGFSREVNLAMVENKTAIWQLDVPLSVNPDNVNYPAYIDHGIFQFGGTQADPQEVATYTVESVQSSPTPLIFGPTPIEDVGAIADDLFEE